MNQNSARFWLLAGRLAAVLQLAALPAISCGIEWKKPKTHFDGVNEYGFVSYWDQIGALDLGEGVEIPLIIGFRSDWDQSSPSLGSGWLLGILDAHIVQKNEGAFDMVQPDGYTVPFGRDGKNPSVLGGAKGWKAEIKGEEIAAYAPCGWKLTFLKGKIASIVTPKNRTIEIQRDPEGMATAVVEGTKVLMKVQRDPATKATNLLLGGGIVRLEQVERPLIQSIQGMSVVAARRSAVGKIVLPDGGVRTFEYLPDQNLHPRMVASGPGQAPRTMVWDAATRRIISDGSWSYEITPSDIPGHNARISRSDASGKKELWHYDAVKGTETVLSADKSLRVKSYFTGGTLAGRLRKSETMDAKGRMETKKCAYDEKGNLLRLVTKGSGQEPEHVWEFSKKEGLPRPFSNAKVVLNESDTVKRSIFKDGRIVFQNVSLNGESFEIYYDPKGNARIYGRREKQWLSGDGRSAAILNQIASQKTSYENTP